MGMLDLPPELQTAVLSFLTRRRDIHHWIGLCKTSALVFEDSRTGLILACKNKYGVNVDCENPKSGSLALFRASLYVRYRDTEWTMKAARNLFAECLYCDTDERNNAYAVVRSALEYLDESDENTNAQEHETSLDRATATLAASWAREEYMLAAKDIVNPGQAGRLAEAMVDVLRQHESPTSKTSRYWAEEHLLWIISTEKASAFAEDVLDRIIEHETFRSHAAQEWAAASYKLIKQHGSSTEAKKFAKSMLDRILRIEEACSQAAARSNARVEQSQNQWGSTAQSKYAQSYIDRNISSAHTSQELAAEA
ncbi:hypothetical protein Q7P37_002379 [Cladosporium fusiforme]